MINRIILILSSITLLTACDILNDKKSLSESISDDSIKKLASPVTDERIVPKHKVKHKYNTIQIPKKFYKKVSLTINESLPLKSVLYEIAKQLKINIQIDPSIDSKIIFMADNKPFIEVVDAICDLADLRYTIQNDFLKIVKDLPYSQNYDVQFLNISRDSENKIAIATEVTGSKNNNMTNNNDSSITNSDSTVTFKAKSEFWDDLSNGIKIILSSNNNNKYSINKQSGIITVYANSKCHKDVQLYLDKIKESNNSQVLIEAKIIEVVLKNKYRRGINWNALLQNSKISTNIVTNFANSGEEMPLFRSQASNVDNIIKALEQFGSVRTISNPRITAMNNQAAVIKIAENQVYFKLNYDKVYSSRESLKEDINVSSDIKTIPIGLVMFVQPSIDIKNQVVSLFLRPTITKLQNTVNDPAVDIAIQSASKNNKSEDIKSKIPVTAVREVASVLKLNDGEVAVLGGFMEIISSKSKSGLPLVKDVPILGELSSEYNTNDKVVELVILVKVKISEPTTLQRAADIRLQRFVPDPRPF